MWTTELVIILTAVLTPSFGSLDCPQLGINLLVKTEPQKIFSPGYPDFYRNSRDCLWYLTVDKKSSDLAIQIVTLQIDVDDHEGECNSDYIEAIAGSKESSGVSIERWCGKERKVLKYQGDHMILKFHTDEHYVGSGFILSYNLVKQSNAACLLDAPRSITIDDSPLYEVFKGNPAVKRCQWHFSTSNRNSRLMIEMFKPSVTMSSTSQLILYEGSEATGEINFEWNPRESLFSKMFLSSSEATLVLFGVDNDEENEDGVILKISSVDPYSYSADCTRQNPANLEFHGAPVFFSMPFKKDRRSSQPCALVLRNTDGMDIRLDALAVKDAVLTCEAEPIKVIDANATAVDKACNRGQTPVYFIGGDRATISVLHRRTMFLMASAMESRCNGLHKELTAYKDVILTEWYPKDGYYRNLAKCRIHLSASSRDDAVKAEITWQIPSSQSITFYSDSDVCDGDFINVYDGNSESSKLLYSSCHQENRSGHQVHVEVVSSRRSLFIEFDADKAYITHSMKIKYHSVPAGKTCKGPMEISVNKERQTVTSPNYPGIYPLDQVCDYILRSANPRPDEDIVVKVINAKLPATCQDILTVYTGEEMDDDDVIDRICGNDEGKVIKVQKALASMRFISNDEGSHEGWSVEVYVEKRGSSAGTRVVWKPILVIFAISLINLLLL